MRLAAATVAADTLQRTLSWALSIAMPVPVCARPRPGDPATGAAPGRQESLMPTAVLVSFWSPALRDEGTKLPGTRMGEGEGGPLGAGGCRFRGGDRFPLLPLVSSLPPGWSAAGDDRARSGRGSLPGFGRPAGCVEPLPAACGKAWLVGWEACSISLVRSSDTEAMVSEGKQQRPPLHVAKGSEAPRKIRSHRRPGPSVPVGVRGAPSKVAVSHQQALPTANGTSFKAAVARSSCGTERPRRGSRLRHRAGSR